MSTRVDKYAATISNVQSQNVLNASAPKTVNRVSALEKFFGSAGDTQDFAAKTKMYVLDHLAELLQQFESKCVSNGIKVHWAEDAKEAKEIILSICRASAPEGATIVKAKSMATEEIHLNKHLEEAGYKPVETDLGEFVIQIDGDVPTHIVTPIIHKNRHEVSESFVRENLGPKTDVPEELAAQARAHLRQKFNEAPIGISGVNFGIAETGRIVLVENEGNSRLSTTMTDTHIAVMGLEKLLPSEADLATFLPLLAGSATNQRITTYCHFISGPRRPEQHDGPKAVHVVILDNGRSKILNGPYRDILRCIRCGACLNTCPVYRQVGGHGYQHVYSGPLGAVLAPGLEGVEVYGDLAKASSLCGACEEVCPVRIPIPSLLLKLRDEGYRKKVIKDGIPWSLFEMGATRPFLWRSGLTMVPMAGVVPHPLKSAWTGIRELPKREGESFRAWWTKREK